MTSSMGTSSRLGTDRFPSRLRGRVRRARDAEDTRATRDLSRCARGDDAFSGGDEAFIGHRRDSGLSRDEVFLGGAVSNAATRWKRRDTTPCARGGPGALEIKITTDDEDGKTLIVEDDGFGIREASSRKIWEPSRGAEVGVFGRVRARGRHRGRGVEYYREIWRRVLREFHGERQGGGDLCVARGAAARRGGLVGRRRVHGGGGDGGATARRRAGRRSSCTSRARINTWCPSGVETVLKKYSSFVGFPSLLSGERRQRHRRVVDEG